MSIKVQVPAMFTVYGILVKGKYPDNFYYSAPNRESLTFTEKIFLEHLGDRPSPYVDTLCGLGVYKPVSDTFYISMSRPKFDVSKYLLHEIENAFLDDAYSRIAGLGKGLKDVERNESEVAFKFAPNSFDDENSAITFLKSLSLVIHELCYSQNIDNSIVAENHRKALKIRVHSR